MGQLRVTQVVDTAVASLVICTSRHIMMNEGMFSGCRRVMENPQIRTRPACHESYANKTIADDATGCTLAQLEAYNRGCGKSTHIEKSMAGLRQIGHRQLHAAKVPAAFHGFLPVGSGIHTAHYNICRQIIATASMCSYSARMAAGGAIKITPEKAALPVRGYETIAELK